MPDKRDVSELICDVMFFFWYALLSYYYMVIFDNSCREVVVLPIILWTTNLTLLTQSQPIFFIYSWLWFLSSENLEKGVRNPVLCFQHCASEIMLAWGACFFFLSKYHLHLLKFISYVGVYLCTNIWCVHMCAHVCVCEYLWKPEKMELQALWAPNLGTWSTLGSSGRASKWDGSLFPVHTHNYQ